MLAGIRQAAKQLGMLVYHTRDSRGSDKGFCDLVIVGRGRCLFLELKGPKGRVSGEQLAWLKALRDAGQEAYIVFPDGYDQVLTDLVEMATS